MTTWVLYEDPRGAALRPLTWLRPASGLLLGAETGEARWRRLTGGEPLLVVCSDRLSPLSPGRVGWSAVEDAAKAPDPAAPTAHSATSPDALLGEDTVWVSDLLLPDPSTVASLRELPPDARAFAGAAGTVGRDPGPTGVAVGPSGAAAAGPVAFRAGPETRRRAAQGKGVLLDAGASRLPRDVEVGGERLGGLGDLIRLQERFLTEDLARLMTGSAETGEAAKKCSPGDGFAYDPEKVLLRAGCRIDAGAVLDAREGPIVLEEDCEVFPHTWLRGPLFAARGTRFLGGKIGGGSSIGPVCRVRGEIEASIFLGFDNKAHDGFVGHSVLGEWVNLGALTTTSDLKNNYSEISLEREGRRERTGLNKVGVFLGDHVKTRIGTLLTCGTVVGVGSTLIGNPAVASHLIEDFRWGEEGEEYDINKFLQTAEIVLTRRRMTLTPELERALRDVHRESAESRRMRLAPRQEAGGI